MLRDTGAMLYQTIVETANLFEPHLDVKPRTKMITTYFVQQNAVLSFVPQTMFLEHRDIYRHGGDAKTVPLEQIPHMPQQCFKMRFIQLIVQGFHCEKIRLFAPTLFELMICLQIAAE
jgi:hypothetical protein